MPERAAPAVIDAIADQVAAGRTYGEIGKDLGMTRNAVGGVVFRLRQARDPRVTPAGPGPIATREQQRDRVAAAFADGARDLTTVAKRTDMTLDVVRQRWDEICRAMGSQAR